MTWLTTEAVEVLEIVEQPVEDRQQEYMVSLSIKTSSGTIKQGTKFTPAIVTISLLTILILKLEIYYMLIV